MIRTFIPGCDAHNRIAHGCLAGLLPGFLLLAGATPVSACDAVRIETQSPLDFGLLRVQQGTTGWVVVMPGGGVGASPGVSFSDKVQPVPGQVKVQAPPGSLVLLNLEQVDGAGRAGSLNSKGIGLRAVSLGRGVQPLPRNGHLWELRMPRMDADAVEIMLSVGAELQFSQSDKPRSYSATFYLGCVSTETDLAP